MDLRSALAGALNIDPPEAKLEDRYFDGTVKVKGEVVLVFEGVPKAWVTGFQVLPSGPKTQSTRETEMNVRHDVRVDWEKLFAVLSVKSIVILSDGSNFRVFLNLEIDDAHPGINFWDGYDELLVRLLAPTWAKGRVYWNEGKPALCLSGSRRSNAASDTEIFFERSL